MRRESTTRDSETQWEEVAPLLDDHVLRLGKKDQEAILLRFYERKSLAEMGEAMGLSEKAAQKRVQRAVGKLRWMLGKKGVKGTAEGLSAVLVGNVVGKMPEGLLQKVMAGIGGGGAGNGTAEVIAKGALKMMVLAKVKVAAAVVGVVLAGVAVAGLFAQSSAPKDGIAATPPATQVTVAAEPVSIKGAEQIQFLVDGMNANLALLDSYRAEVSATVNMESTPGTPHIDITKKSVWLQKGDRYRQDTNMEQRVDGKLPPIQKDGILPQRYSERAFSGDVTLEYVPKQKYAAIRTPAASNIRLQPEREQGEPLYWGVRLMGQSLGDIARGQFPGKRPEDNGFSVKNTIEWVGKREYQGRGVDVVKTSQRWSISPGEQVTIYREIYVDPQRGFTIPYATGEFERNGSRERVELIETECMQSGNGAWVPRKTKYKWFGVSETTVSVDSFVPNPSISDQDLKVKLADGTNIDDHIVDTQYQYGLGTEGTDLTESQQLLEKVVKQ